MKITKKIPALALFVTTFLATTLPAFAQTEGTGITNPVIGGLGDNPETAATGELATNYFVDIWNTLISIGGLVVIVMFLWGALEWITAGGDSGKIEKARNKITQAIIGLVILVSSFVILGFISQVFFGDEFSILNLTFTRPGGTE